MKKIVLIGALFSAVLISSIPVYAVKNSQLTNTSRWSMSLTGLYLQPNASNLDYAVFTKPLPLTTPNWSQITLKPDYHPAFDLGLEYHFADAVNKLNVDWFYLSTKDSDSFQAGDPNSSVAPPYYFGPLAQALVGSDANSKVKFEVSNVGVSLAHLISLGKSLQLNPFIGINVAYLKQDITSTYVGSDSSEEPFSLTTYNTSKFTGVGPRFGIDTTYFITEHVGVMARIAGTLLAGSMRSNTNFNSFGAGNRTLVYTTLADTNQNAIVPELDGKLELNYLVFSKENMSNITLAVGYLFATYLNGINQVFPTSLVPGAFNGGVIAIETASQSQSDLELNGPYATLTWKF